MAAGASMSFVFLHRTLEALEIRARDRRPVLVRPVLVGTLRQCESLRAVVQYTIDLACDRRGVRWWHEDAAAVGEELPRMAVRCRDHHAASTDRVRERS